jgi:fructose-bisphosphate aldolase class I
MNRNEIITTANALLFGDKGLLAMDESIATCNRRFEAAGIPQNVFYRRSYRELIVTTSGLGSCLNGAILFDETIRQSTEGGILFVDVLKEEGIIPGIKVDEGTVNLAGFPGEKITAGLDGLRERLAEYFAMGARFAKWRAVIAIGHNMPSAACISANTSLLALYAAICQEAGMVPIVEPEVLMDGSHSIELCFAATKNVLQQLFKELYTQNVILEGLILKSNMIISGSEAIIQADIEEVAETTINCFLQTVPKAVAGIVFLSGGQSPELASAHLNAMQLKYAGKLPWKLSFSYSRAIQQPALDRWKGMDDNRLAAQQELFHRASLNVMANSGRYTATMETGIK